MRVVPKMMRGVFRTALRLSFQEVAQARAEGDVNAHGNCFSSHRECC